VRGGEPLVAAPADPGIALAQCLVDLVVRDRVGVLGPVLFARAPQGARYAVVAACQPTLTLSMSPSPKSRAVSVSTTA
jgi:hypothetical protein